jgi:hypothetical protein
VCVVNMCVIEYPNLTIKQSRPSGSELWCGILVLRGVSYYLDDALDWERQCCGFYGGILCLRCFSEYVYTTQCSMFWGAWSVGKAIWNVVSLMIMCLGR